MKKMYLDPEMEVIELKISSAILVGSDDATSDIPGGDDGSTGGSETDSSLIGGGEGLG